MATIATIAIVGRADIKAECLACRADVKVECLALRLVPRSWRRHTSESRQDAGASSRPQSGPRKGSTGRILETCCCACTACCVGGRDVHVPVDGDPQRATQRLAALIASRESAAHHGQRDDK